MCNSTPQLVAKVLVMSCSYLEEENPEGSSVKDSNRGLPGPPMALLQQCDFICAAVGAAGRSTIKIL